MGGERGVLIIMHGRGTGGGREGGLCLRARRDRVRVNTSYLEAVPMLARKTKI